jgi:hypothetical protein
MQCALHCKHGVKYSAHPPVYIMWTVVPAICNVYTSPHIQALIFNWTYLRWYWRYVHNSMRPTLQSLCQIQRTPSILRYVNCGLEHIQYTYSSTYSGFNIQLNVSTPLLEIYQQLNVRYTANLVTNTAHNLQFTLCELWSRPYTKYFPHRIFRLQYSAEGSSPAIGGISTIHWALYCNLGAKYSARTPVYAMCTVVPDIYNAITVTYIQVSTFRWTYLRCYSWYLNNTMRVKLQFWSHRYRTPSSLSYVNCGSEIYNAITAPHI